MANGQDVYIHPRKLTWNLKMNPWKRRFLLTTIIFRFYVSFRFSGGYIICVYIFFIGTVYIFLKC